MYHLRHHCAVHSGLYSRRAAFAPFDGDHPDDGRHGLRSTSARLIEINGASARTAYIIFYIIFESRSAEATADVKRKPVQRLGTWRCRIDRCLSASGRVHWLVLLLVLAIAASGLLHAVSGGDTAFAASHPHDLASMGQDAGGEPCCADHDGEPHGTICGIANGCSFCVPVVSSPVLVRPNAEPVEIEPDAGHSGRVPSPHSRPPKFFANV